MAGWRSGLRSCLRSSGLCDLAGSNPVPATMKLQLPLKEYKINKSLSWKDRYKELEAHYNEEKKLLISQLKIQHIENVNAALHLSQMIGVIKNSKEYLDWENVLRSQFELLVKAVKKQK